MERRRRKKEEVRLESNGLYYEGCNGLMVVGKVEWLCGCEVLCMALEMVRSGSV